MDIKVIRWDYNSCNLFDYRYRAIWAPCIVFFQDLSFIRNYTRAQTVVLTAKHSTSGGNAAVECNGIVSWIEVILQLAMLSFLPGSLRSKPREFTLIITVTIPVTVTIMMMITKKDDSNSKDNYNDNDNDKGLLAFYWACLFYAKTYLLRNILGLLPNFPF